MDLFERGGEQLRGGTHEENGWSACGHKADVPVVKARDRYSARDGTRALRTIAPPTFDAHRAVASIVLRARGSLNENARVIDIPTPYSAVLVFAR
jgi:hypothetical protein